MTRLPNNGMQLTALRAARNRRPHALSGCLVAKALFRIRRAGEANRYAHRPTSCYSSGFARGIGRMIVTAWNNGSTGYGVKVTMQDREQFFSKEWRSVSLELEGSAVQVEVNVAKPSFWSPRCGELINREIGTWLKENGLAPWPWREPPKLLLEPLSNRRFLLHKPSTQRIE